MNIALSFERVLQGPPAELRAFEKEVSAPLFMIHAPMDSQTQADIEDIIVDALMRRRCNPIQMHLRLKKGFNATMNYDELANIPLTIADVDVARKLSNFYVRVSNLRARIMHEMHQSHNLQQNQEQPQQNQEQLQQNQKQLQQNQEQPQQNQEQSHHLQQLQQAHATEMEKMQHKQRENEAHFARIMQSIVLNPNSDSEKMCMNDQLTDAGLNALDQQLHDIMERGCTSNHLRCIKIMEAAMEQQIYDALVAELNALDH
jgi:septal ring factor EnvC (AmiA/AmiB activator)